MALTIDELVVEVCDSIDRPDIHDRILKQFQEVLREAHSIDTYKRDLATQLIADPFVSSCQTSINTAQLAKTVRTIAKIETYNSYTGSGITLDPYIPGIVQQDKFVDVSIGMGSADYFGFAYQQTWAKLGNTVTLNGVNQDTTMIGLTAICWPTYTYDALTALYSTDSWILVEADYLIKAILKTRCARLVQSQELLQTCRLAAAEARQTFIQSFASDSICL